MAVCNIIPILVGLGFRGWGPFRYMELKLRRKKKNNKNLEPLIRGGRVQGVPTSGTTTVTKEMAEAIEASLGGGEK